MSQVEILYNEAQTLRIFLAPRSSGAGTPAPDGYLSVEQQPGLYRTNVGNDLVGEFDLWATDQQGGMVYRAYLELDVLDALYRPVGRLDQLPPGPARSSALAGVRDGAANRISDVVSAVQPEQNRMDLCGVSTQQPGYILNAGNQSGLLWNLRNPDGQTVVATAPSRLTYVNDLPGLRAAPVSWGWFDQDMSQLTAFGSLDADQPSLGSHGSFIWWSAEATDQNLDLSDGRDRVALFRNPFCQNATYRAQLQIRGGQVLIVPPRNVTDNPGIYQVELAWLQDGENLLGSSLVSVEQSLLQRAAQAGGMGPLTIGRIRSRLRDFQEINDNGRYEWPIQEVLQAMLDPIEYYNETPPYSDAFTVANFPYRQRYLDAVVSRLLIIQAHGLLRNQYTIQGEGIQMDNRDRNAKIMQVADQLWAEYRQFVHADKSRRNARYAFRSF